MDTRNTDMSSTVTFHMPVKEQPPGLHPLFLQLNLKTTSSFYTL